MSDGDLFAVRLVRTVPARRRRRIASRLALKLGADTERIRALLGRPAGPITKPIPRADARQIHGFFVQEGVAVELVEIAPGQQHDVFKTSTNLKLTSMVHRPASGAAATTASGSWPDSRSWTGESDWSETVQGETEHDHAVRLIARVPPQRIDGLVKRLAERLQVDPRRLRRLLSRPPGLLSKPISRSTSERITSILSAEGVAVESVALLERGDGGPGSPDFDLRLTLDMARMRAQVGDPSRVLGSRARRGGSAGPARGAVEAAEREPIVIETTPQRAVSTETPTAPPLPRREEIAAVPSPPPVEPVIEAVVEPAAKPRLPQIPPPPRDEPGAAAGGTPAAPGAAVQPRVRSGPPSEPNEPRGFQNPPNTEPADDRTEPPDRPGRRRTPFRKAAPPVFDDGDVEIPPAPSRPEPRPTGPSLAAAAAPRGAEAPGESGPRRRRAAAGRTPTAARDSAEAPGSAPAGERVDPGRRGLYTLLVFDLALLALLGGAGAVLSSPGGVTVTLLFSLLLLGQAMFTRSQRRLSDLFAGLAVTPMLFMFPALVDTLSPWHELSADLQLVVISLLTLLSTLYLAEALGFDRYQLGLALWRRSGNRRRGAARLLRTVVASVGGLVLQGAVGASGLLLGMVVLRYLPSPPNALGLGGTEPLLALLALLLAGMVQELFFRGLLQNVGIRALGVPLGIALPALLFVLLFSGGPLGGDFLFIMLLAVVSGLVSHLTGSVLGLGLMNALALAIYIGLLGDPLTCLQGGFDLACLAPGWPASPGGLGGVQ